MDNKNKPSLDDLFNDLNHPNPNINRNAYIGMYSFWPKEAKSILLENLKSDDITIRRKSIIALSYYGNDAVKSVVEVYLSTQEKVLKISCLKVLVKVAVNHNLSPHISGLKKVIDEARKDCSVEITLGLVNLLRQIGDLGVPILIEIAEDKNILRSKAAITALGDISSPEVKVFLP